MYSRFLSCLVAVAIGCAAGLFSATGFSADGKAAAKVEKVTFTNKMVDGKKTWVPSETTMPAGKVEITLVNELGEAHGFRLDGLLKDPVIVPAKESKTVTIESAAAGSYKFSCQLHPAHVGGQITVK